jgi:hypothetical protein
MVVVVVAVELLGRVGNGEVLGLDSVGPDGNLSTVIVGVVRTDVVVVGMEFVREGVCIRSRRALELGGGTESCWLSCLELLFLASETARVAEAYAGQYDATGIPRFSNSNSQNKVFLGSTKMAAMRYLQRHAYG